MLPDKDTIENWECTPVVERLMKDYRWSKQVAQQWFTDFMRWIYSSQKYYKETGIPFEMDGLHYLDDVWHVYILHTKEYFKMSNDLFKVEYIHHFPAPSFQFLKIDKTIYKNQLLFLLNDWGESYIDRVWAYAADMSDIISNHEHDIPLV